MTINVLLLSLHLHIHSLKRAINSRNKLYILEEEYNFVQTQYTQSSPHRQTASATIIKIGKLKSLRWFLLHSHYVYKVYFD